MTVKYHTQFGSLKHYEKGRVEPIDDDVKHYAFSNCFEIANAAKPYEKVVFGQNQIYVMEALRAEGTSPWFTCAHDEFALSMDGEIEVHLIKLDQSQIVKDEEKNGWMKIKRGHQAMLPKNTAYQFKSAQAGVLILQTCKGDLSIEKWADICQTA